MLTRSIYYLIGFYIFSLGLYGQEFTKEKCFLINNEKTFVHLENNIFVAGQFMSYKAYVVNAYTLKPSTRSKIIYFEIIGTGGKILQWHQELINGTCFGRITLPNTINEGFYTLKAYTNWMRNFSSDLFFTQNIFIARLGSEENEIISGFIPSTDMISAVPISGSIIEGTENKFSYFISEDIPLTSSAIAQVVDTSGSIIESFGLMNRRVGGFSFIPDAGNTYYFKVINGTKSIQTKIHDVGSSGYAIAIEDLNGVISFGIFTSFSDTGLKVPFNLYIYSGEQLVSKKSFYFDNGKYFQQLLKNRFKKPTFHAVLKGPSGEIVCHHLSVLTPPKKLQPEIIGIKDVYEGNKDVMFQIKNPDHDTCNLNISIRINASNPFEYITNKNIQFALYDKSELGTQIIEEQAVNFNVYIPHISNSYETFTKVSLPDTMCFYPIETHGYILSGNIKEKKSHKPLVDQVVLLSCIDSVSIFDYAITNENGYFYFLIKEENLNKKNILTLAGDNFIQSTEIDWEIDYKNRITNREVSDSKYHLNVKEQDFIKEFKKVKLVELVYDSLSNVNTDIIQQNDKRKSFYSIPDYIIYPKDYYDLPDFTQISENLLPTIYFKEKKDMYFIKVYDPDNERFLPEGALVLLNGIPFNDLHYIQTLGSDKIERIEIVNSRIFYGKLNFNGILSIFTKDLEIPGTYLVRNTYIPELQNKIEPDTRCQYDNYRKKFSKLPDFRQVLYWNPDVVLQPGEEYDIRFRTSHLKGKYNLNIQGISSEGNPIFLNKTITVK